LDSGELSRHNLTARCKAHGKDGLRYLPPSPQGLRQEWVAILAGHLCEACGKNGWQFLPDVFARHAAGLAGNSCRPSLQGMQQGWLAILAGCHPCTFG